MQSSQELRARIGPALRALRVRAKLSQKTLAALLDVARSTYSYYELGLTSPKPEDLYLLSQYYKVPMERFFQPEPEPLSGPRRVWETAKRRRKEH